MSIFYSKVSTDVNSIFKAQRELSKLPIQTKLSDTQMCVLNHHMLKCSFIDEIKSIVSILNICIWKNRDG